MPKNEICQYNSDGKHKTRFKFCDPLKELLETSKIILVYKINQFERGIYAIVKNNRRIMFSYCPFCGYNFEENLKPATMSKEEWALAKKAFMSA